MSVTPNSISLRYKKYLDAPYVNVTVTPAQPVTSIVYTSVPSWLQLSVVSQTVDPNAGYKISSVTYKVQVKASDANNLAPGNYFDDVRFDIYENNGNRAVPEYLTVNLEVIDTVQLSLSKTDYSFQHTFGAAAPATQPLTITTENAWSIIGDQPWMTFSASNGNGTQTINVGVDPSGLAVGLYEGTFQVDDGQTIKQGKISLLVSGDDSGGDYLDISSTSLSFTEIYQQAPTRSASVTISTSLEATITTATAWLSLSTGTIPAGEGQLVVNTQNTEGLAIGSYSGTIKVQTGFSTKNINVLLRIVEVATSGIESGKLYFAEDRNTLVLSSATPNAEAFIEFMTPQKNYERRIPFFNSLAEIIIGLETATLLKSENLPAVLNTGGFVPVKPLSMDFTVYDKIINSTSIIERQAFSQVLFLNGRSPVTENRLTNIPDRITVTPDALISLSFYSKSLIESISITGDITAEAAMSNLATEIYTAIVDLADYNLVPGNHITIEVGPISLEVAIKPLELETTRLIWLNEWDCPEVFNLDGTVEIENEDDSTKVELSASGKELTRIIEVKEPVSFRIDTGNIYSREEAEWLAKVVRSKKTWLEINGKRFEVIREFRSLPVYRTRETVRNYTLRFKAAEI